MTEKKNMFHNFYQCPRCGEHWEDFDEAQPDDDCPNDKCGLRHITPYESRDAEVKAKVENKHK